MGALGPSAPPARSAALRHTSPAAPPPTAQALPLGAAYALAARRSRPSGLALSLVTRSAPSRPSGARAPKGRRSGALTSRARPPSSRRCGGRQFRPPRALAAQAPPSSRFARGGARSTPPAGGNACGRDMPAGQPAGKAKASAALAAAPPLRRPCLPVSRPARANRGGCPALCGPPAPSYSGKRWCFLCLLLLVVCLAPVASGGWSAGLVVSLAGLLPGLPGLSGRPLWRRRLPVSWRRFLPPAPSGLLVLLLVGWLLSVAGSAALWVPLSRAVSALICGFRHEKKSPTG